MNLLKQLWIITLFYLLGELVNLIIPSPLPGNVIGFILLFVALKTNLIKIVDIENVTSFFLNNLAILFIPGGVGIINVFNLFDGNIIKIFLIITISTILTIIATGLTISLLGRIKK